MEPTTTTMPVQAMMEAWSIRLAFEQGGFVMYVIALIGILAVVLIVERLMVFSKMALNKKDLTDGLFSMIVQGNIRGAIDVCSNTPAPLTNTIKAGLVQALNKRPDEEIQVAMDAAVLREQPRIEGYTAFLAVFGNIAVLAGLLGTIIGMIRSFMAVAAADPTEKALELSKGISHALNCTAFGLAVAMLSIIAYGWFQMRIQRLENEMAETSMSLLNLVASNRDKMKDL